MDTECSLGIEQIKIYQYSLNLIPTEVPHCRTCYRLSNQPNAMVTSESVLYGTLLIPNKNGKSQLEYPIEKKSVLIGRYVLCCVLVPEIVKSLQSRWFTERCLSGL